jgi:predicted negative regulator of RcsB-dependent stress response
MATVEQDDANVFDAETINWRLIVYPVLLALVVIVGGLGYYYYLQNQRDEAESTARAALVQAKTPEEMAKVADQFPHTDQATLALLNAAGDSFAKRDFTTAISDYQRVVDASGTDPQLVDSAKLGLASSFEATGKINEAIHAYTDVGDRGAKSAYAAFAYDAAARLYLQLKDKVNQRKMLTQAAALDGDSPSVKIAQQSLKEMSAAEAPPVTFNVPATPAPSAPVTATDASAPAPTAPAK